MAGYGGEVDISGNLFKEVVRSITEIALRYGADISIEDLKMFGPKGKRFNREVMRIPFLTFKKNLIQRCFDKNITLNIVDSWHTSKFCSHCGAVGKGHDSRDYALFRCKKCGVIVNSDRKASLNIAVKSLLERRSHNLNNSDFFQISNRRVPVNGLMRSDEVGLPNVAVRHANQLRNAPSLAMGQFTELYDRALRLPRIFLDKGRPRIQVLILTATSS